MSRRHVYPRSSAPLVTTDLAVEPQAPAVAAAAPPADLYRLALILAADAITDVRSARRVLLQGPEAVRGRAGERLRAAAASLGVSLPLVTSELRSA